MKQKINTKKIDPTQESVNIDITEFVDNDPTKNVKEIVAKYSEEWASIIKPFALHFVWFFGFLIFVPYICICIPCISKDRIELLLGWSNTVLAPLVGIISGITGYYFGRRNK